VTKERNRKLAIRRRLQRKPCYTWGSYIKYDQQKSFSSPQQQSAHSGFMQENTRNAKSHFKQLRPEGVKSNIFSLCPNKSRRSRGSYGLNDRVSIPGRGRDFPLRHLCVQTDYGAHSTSYPMGSTGAFPGAWSWPLASIHCPQTS
jgi:hypothetical protein